MFDSLLPLALKAAATACAVVIASTIAERTRPAIAAIILALPVSAGPGYLLLALQHDAQFLASASLAGLPINLSTAVLVVTYAALARHGVDAVSALGLGIVTWLASTLALRALPTTLLWASLELIVLYPAILWATWSWRHGPANRLVERRWYDVPVRALLVATIVVSIVTLSDAIGPVATGSALLFPTTYFSFMLLMHRRLGGDFVASAMIQSLFMLIGFIGGVYALHLGASFDRLGLGLGLLFAVPAVYALSVLAFMRRRARP